MKKKEIASKGEIVKMSNAIIRGQWKPKSVWEPRIVALVASKVREDDKDFLRYEIPISELTGVSDENLSGVQYQEIKKSILKLGRSFVIIQGKRPRDFMQYAIFATAGYENGCLVAQFHPDLKPHFLNLKSQFTEYKLMEYLKLPSMYSQRLFEILKSWDDTIEHEIGLEDLHFMLNTPASCQKDFRNFRLRVLDKAHKDIHALTSLKFEWEPIRKGQGVTSPVVGIRFVFSKKRALPIATRKKEATQEKTSKQNNKDFLEAVECWKNQEGQTCLGGLRSKAVCELCAKIVQARA